MGKINPRVWAFDIMWQVSQGKRHLQNLLEDEFGRHGESEARDKAFCQHLLFATLRNRLWLEFVLSHTTQLKRLQKKVLQLLLLASAEMQFMRTPDYAAVSAWVNVCRAIGQGQASGLVNAVLRALTRMENMPTIPDGNKANYLSIKYSHPLWLVQMWLGQFGFEKTLQWLEACQEQPQLSVRANTLKITPQDLVAYLRPYAAEINVHPLHPWCLVVKQPCLPLPGFSEGLWQRQDAGACALTELLPVRPGLRVLDMCAGSGGKSGHLAQLMANQGELVALDLSAGRAKAWADNMQRLGVTCAKMLVQDARKLEAGFNEYFDCILLDAPCSGTGTTGRRPDVRWRREAKDIATGAQLQKQLLAAAVGALKPGGSLLYATCSNALAENDYNIKWLLQNYKVMGHNKDNAFWRTYPKPLGCDGFFAAHLVKE